MCIEEVNARESRELWRVALAFNGGKEEEIRRATPNWFIEEQAYLGIPRDVAIGLVMAMGADLIEGDMYITWPATIEGLPLIKVWEDIHKLSGVEQ